MTTTEEKSGIVNYMQTMSVIGAALQGNTGVIACIITGQMDAEIKSALEYKEKLDLENGCPKDQTYKAEEHLSRIKDYLRLMVTNAIKQGEKEERYHTQAEIFAAENRKRQAHEKLVEDFKKSTKPHPMGTVDELAKRFGVSKSEIRRRKADNTLDQLLLQSTQNA